MNNEHYELEKPANELITKKIKEGWVINFIGAGEKQFVEQVATSIGIFASNSLAYNNTSQGTSTAMNKMSASRSTYTSNVSKGIVATDGFFSND